MPLRNLNALRMFDAAARHLNFRVAADELNLTQGAVAQQVRGLEATLGSRLFHRHARGLELTEAGRGLHPPVRQALELIDTATAGLAPAPRRITLSVPPSLAAKWLVPRLNVLAHDLPETDLRVVASERLSDFRGDGVDLAIRQGRPPFGERVDAVALAPLDPVAVANPDLARKIGPVDGPADLLDQTLIQDGHGVWDRLARGRPQPPRMLRFNQTTLAIDAAAMGQGVAIAPRLLVADALARGELVALATLPDTAPGGFYLLVPKRKSPPRGRAAVTEWIIAQAAADPGPDPTPEPGPGPAA